MALFFPVLLALWGCLRKSALIDEWFMRKWLAFLIVGILLLAILQGGHGVIDSLLMFAFFLTDNKAGHFILVLIVLVPLGSMIWGGHVRSRRDNEQAMKQMVDVVRQRTAAMEARVALLEGRSSDVRERARTAIRQSSLQRRLGKMVLRWSATISNLGLDHSL